MEYPRLENLEFPLVVVGPCWLDGPLVGRTIQPIIGFFSVIARLMTKR
jgi:hypothetical protein